MGSISIKKAHKVYLRFEALGGSLNCKLFTEIFPQLQADESFEYKDMKAAYNPEEFAKSYLKPEFIEQEMKDEILLYEYLSLQNYVQGGMTYD